MVRKGSVFSQDKLFLHGDRVREYLTTGLTKAPVTLEVDLTNKCNNRCSGCAGFNGDNLSMLTANAYQLINEAADFGVRGLIFTGGGEPLLHPESVRLISYANKECLDVGLITSGQRNPDDLDLETLVSSSTWIRISADAGSAKVYAKTHGLNAKKYMRMWRFTEELVRAKRNTGSECTIGMGYLTGKNNVLSEHYDIERFVRRAASTGVDYAQLRPFHNTNRQVKFSDEIKRELKSFNIALLESNHKYDRMEKDDGVRDYDYCHGAHFASVVTANGDLTVCCHLRNQEVGAANNVFKKGLAAAWQDEQHLAKIREVDVHKCLPYCRADHFNNSLNNLVEGYKHGHKNFL